MKVSIGATKDVVFSDAFFPQYSTNADHFFVAGRMKNGTISL
jgi:hypothetical protein